ncbi:MAG: hypothetical protein GY949_15125 [Gammaproteobacteria bacterium]|nr:hypothetical protein [Gammaproteobacteria bacterium]
MIAELQQNHELMRAQTRNDLAMGLVAVTSMPASNSQLASLVRRAAAGETLTPDENVQIVFFNASLIRYWENVHYQYRQGLFDSAEFSAQRDAWKSLLSRDQS